MGKEQDLLEAARSGNVSVIEKILTPRKKMTVGNLPVSLGPFQSLRRAPNANCHDQNGDTPLHLAALNGHIEAVKVLLRHEGSVNVMDYKGCFPLHLAAWSGNPEMCIVLLNHGPSIAKANEQNQVGETALHCASQYGHTQTVAVLLQHLAEPLIRNNQGESPLDLAAQYGRLDSVELLIRKHPALLCDDVSSHSPLHLSSRNGHRHVVQILLDAGYSVNKSTDSGSALHEAAVFGKQDVVRLLLKRGIDVNVTDSVRRTPLEVLSEHSSQLSLDTGRIILDYLEGRSISDKRSSTQSTSSNLLDEPIYDNPVSTRRHLSDTDSHNGRRASSRSSTDSSVLGATGCSSARFSTCSESYFLYDIPKSRPIPTGLEEVDSASDTSDTAYSLPGVLCLSSSSGSCYPHSNIGGALSYSGLASTPETPKKPPRRKPPNIATKTLSSSPPTMVFINKRASPVPRDSEQSSSNMKEQNGNRNDTFVCDNANITRVTLQDSTDLANYNVDNDTLRHSDNNNVQTSKVVDNGDYLRNSLEGATVEYRRSGGSVSLSADSFQPITVFDWQFFSDDVEM